MNFFRQIVQKPWVTVSATPEGPSDGAEYPLPSVMVGLRVFLGVVAVVFSLLTISYFGRMAYNDWRPLSDPALLWLNTAMLIASSIAFQQSLVAARRGSSSGVRDGLMVGGIFAVIFLIGQLAVWRQLVGAGAFADTNPANAFFYAITGLHALHLLGGLVAWARTSIKLLAGSDLATLKLSVELCAVYWHFLLFIWLAMFGILILT